VRSRSRGKIASAFAQVGAPRFTLAFEVTPTFLITEGAGPIVATAIHDGHELRDECRSCTGLDDATRLREEDPYTARLAAVAPTTLVATLSRFEIDLNRPREGAVYKCADDAWGLDVWRQPPTDAHVARALAAYDDFYAALERVLRDRVRRHGRAVVLDIHSYNHRRDGAGGPAADPAQNPEINLGTGTLDRARWGALVDRFAADFVAASPASHRLDLRENVKFRGGWMSTWIHQTFPETVCALAIEFKKTFMDEWTGALDEAHLGQLRAALAATLPGLEESLAT
jgi:N-formylglutamate deformylase